MRNITYITGKPGTGKTAYLTRRFVDAVEAGEGVAYFDFSGQIDQLLAAIPPRRITDTVLFCPSLFPVGFNPLTGDPTAAGDLVLDTIKSVYGYDTLATPDLDIYLSASAATLAYAGGTLSDIPRLLTDSDFRTTTLKRVPNTGLTDMWTGLYDPMPEKDKYQATKSTLNKLYALTTDPIVSLIIGQPKTSFTLSDTSILIASFAPSMGDKKASVLASLLFATLHPMLAILDDGERIAPRVVLRHNGPLIFAHRFLAQLPQFLLDTLLGTAQTLITFRVGPDDAERLTKEFYLTPQGNYPLVDLPPFTFHRRTPYLTEADQTLPSLDFPTYNPKQVINVCQSRHSVAQKKSLQSAHERQRRQQCAFPSNTRKSK